MGSNEDTFLLRYIRTNVCQVKSKLLLPAVPLIAFVNFREPFILFGSWLFLIVFWLILWLAAPCNPNYNCTPFDENNPNNRKRRDGVKAFIISFFCVYLVFLTVTLYASVFICSDAVPEFFKKFRGGILTNISSVFSPSKSYLKSVRKTSVLSNQQKILSKK